MDYDPSFCFICNNAEGLKYDPRDAMLLTQRFFDDLAFEVLPPGLMFNYPYDSEPEAVDWEESRTWINAFAKGEYELIADPIWPHLDISD